LKDPISKKNLDGYGSPIIQWEKVLKRMQQGFTQAPKTGGPGRHTAWLATVRPDGKPHVMPIGVLFVDDAFYFNTGPKTRKARNIAHNSSSVITIATDDFDIIVQGLATRIVDPARLQRVADAFKKGGWEPTVVKGGLTAKYSAPSAGPPPWNVYEVKPETIFALATSEPYGATRWNFQNNTHRK
jgi:nitroimidazol reductase NimA-like FMN-containing flavoprotein (pyridoxamine 5'-phosphate oxidase superfamily)